MTSLTPQGPTDDNLAEFASELRRLRIEAGNPTLAALSSRTGISKSILSDAFGGRRLPTERTVRLVVAELDGEVATWSRRRDQLDPRRASSPLSDLSATIPQRSVTLRATLGLALASALVASAATSAIWIATTGHGEHDPAPQALLAPENGVDPMRTRCRDGSVVAASEQRLGDAVQVQMLYSTACMAAWGRVTRYDEQAMGNTVTMRVYPATDPSSSRSQERAVPDVQSVYTPMLIETDVDARVCGLATISRGNETIALDPPICI